MKKKLLLIALMVALFVCLFVISTSATELTNYCDIKITLTDGTVTTGYCVIDTSKNSLQRDNIYTSPDSSSTKIAWDTIKIFDARNTTVVGGVDPVEIRGVDCNGSAKYVEEFYCPPTTKNILNTSFTSGWSSLKLVYIPKAVELIDHDSFTNSAVEQVILEEGSALKEIGYSAFQGCKNLVSFNFQEGLESIGRNGFYQTALSGTVKVPNSVTYLAPGAFLSTKIETLILGDGTLKIGYNFAGDFNSTQNAYLKNVYMPAEIEFEENSNEYFFKCLNNVNFYIVGDKSACTSLVATLKAQSTGSYMTFITEDEVTEETTSGYGIIHTEYNRCKAFYDDIHSLNDAEYTFNGFMNEAKFIASCTRCDVIEETQVLDPIIEIIGYSAKINGDRICVGYKLNENSIATYNEENAKTLEFGVVAIVPINEEELKPLYVENGEVKAIDYTISADLEDSYASIDFIILGFDESSYNTSLVMCAYAFDGEGITYICDSGEGESATTFKFSDKAVA